MRGKHTCAFVLAGGLRLYVTVRTWAATSSPVASVVVVLLRQHHGGYCVLLSWFVYLNVDASITRRGSVSNASAEMRNSSRLCCANRSSATATSASHRSLGDSQLVRCTVGVASQSPHRWRYFKYSILFFQLD